MTATRAAGGTTLSPFLLAPLMSVDLALLRFLQMTLRPPAASAQHLPQEPLENEPTGCGAHLSKKVRARSLARGLVLGPTARGRSVRTHSHIPRIKSTAATWPHAHTSRGNFAWDVR